MIILDIETTGLDPVKHSMVSLGAVDYDTGEEFYTENYLPFGKEVDDFALKVNGFTREQLNDTTKLRIYEAYAKFLEWATKRDCLIGGQQVGSFDLPFLKHLHSLGDWGVKWPFGHRSVDLHSVAFAKLGKSLSLDGILIELGLEPEPKPHNALVGARLERDAFKKLLA
jgi:DNA polymerase III epsilon subunit-like protein